MLRYASTDFKVVVYISDHVTSDVGADWRNKLAGGKFCARTTYSRQKCPQLLKL